jgi:hypothetical protein
VISRLVGEWRQEAFAIVLELSVDLSFLDFLRDVSSISGGRAFASEAGFGRPLYTTLPENLRTEYLVEMSESKQNLTNA